jgi:hypothetical protein
MILRIDVPDEIYASLKKHKLLDTAKHSALQGLIDSIILKLNENKPRRIMPEKLK